MKNTEVMVKDVVKEINERNENECRTEVKNLVETILNKESRVVRLKKEIKGLKAELKKLDAPEEVKLDMSSE